ncbi:MAG: MFS transporter, partial [Cytophagaceae bacterium]
CLLLFFAHQWWVGQPVLQLRDLHVSPAFRWGLALFAFYYLLSYSFSYLFPLYAQQGLGFSVERTGRLLFFSNLVSFAIAFLGLRYRKWMPAPKWLLCGAFLCMAIGTWQFSQLAPGAAVESLYLPLALYGACAGLLIVPLSITTFKELNEEVFGHAFRLRNIVRQMCSTCGVAAVTSVLQSQGMVHRAYLNEHLTQYGANTTQRLETLTSLLTQRGLTLDDAKAGALEILRRTVEKQALLASHLNIFVWLTGFALLISVLVLHQKRLN